MRIDGGMISCPTTRLVLMRSCCKCHCCWRSAALGLPLRSRTTWWISTRRSRAILWVNDNQVSRWSIFLYASYALFEDWPSPLVLVLFDWHVLLLPSWSTSIDIFAEAGGVNPPIGRDWRGIFAWAWWWKGTLPWVVAISVGDRWLESLCNAVRLRRAAGMMISSLLSHLLIVFLLDSRFGGLLKGREAGKSLNKGNSNSNW